MLILTENNSLANRYIAELRDIRVQENALRFRNNLKRIGEIMAYELSQLLPYEEKSIQTPLGIKKTFLPAINPVLITILRAGLPFYQGFLDFFDYAESGFIGAYRKEGGGAEKLDIFMGYKAAPSLGGKYVVLVDPMLATGQSLVQSVQMITEKVKPKHVFICSVIASPEGIAYIKENIELDYTLLVGDVDEKLDENAYIIPGLGDAGDLAFGPKT